MKNIPIRLGPLALLLTVISICMTTLGILTFATASADYRLAERYADTVEARYRLEVQGQIFLREAEECVSSGNRLESLDGTETDAEGVTRKQVALENFILTIEIIPDGNRGIRVLGWRIEKEWEPDESMGELWIMD